MKRKIAGLVLFFLTVSRMGSYAQTYPQGVQLLLNNKLSEAGREFKKVLPADKNYPDALLGLTLVYLENEHIDSAIAAFTDFFKTAPDPYPYVYALWDKEIFLFDNKQRRNTMRNFMQRILQDDHAPLSLKAMAHTVCANSFLYENKSDSALLHFQGVGDLKNYSTVGTFENNSSSGFAKNFGPLEHPESNYTFSNHIGAPVQWFPIEDARTDRWLDFQFHYAIDNSVIYAQSFISSEENKNLNLLLGVSGSVKIWINDFLVFSEEEERNTDLDAYTIPVKIQKGNNRILIQIGASEINSSNFMIRFSDEKGKLVNNLHSSRDFMPYTKAAPYPLQPERFFAEEYFEKKIKSGNAGLIDKLMLAYVYNHNDNHYPASKINDELKKSAPKSTIVSEVLIETYNKVNNASEVTHEKEFVKSNDPEGLYGLILRYWEAYNKEDYENAQLLLNRRRELYGNNEDVTIKQLNVYAQKKDVEKFLKELETSLSAYPENATIVAMQYGIQQNLYKDLAKASKVLEDFLVYRFDENITETLSNDYAKAGKSKESLDLLMKLINLKPYATMRYETIATRYFENKNYEKALEWEQKTIDHAPYVGKIHLSKATIYDTEGKKEEAMKYYRKAVQYDPHSYEARKKLRALEGKKDLFTNFKQNDIDALFRNAPNANAYPNSNSIYLLKETLELIYPENGVSEERNDYLIKIFNQAGINNWKEVNIPYNSYNQRLIFDKTEIIKKDGSKVKAETNENQIVFSTLETGDAIHISYRIETSSYGKLSEHFWNSFTFNGDIPVSLARFAMIVPADKKFRFKDYRLNLAPKISSLDDNYRLYEWEAKNNAAIESESLMPATVDIAKRLVISSIPDWNYVANWYSDLSNSKVKADFEIKEKVKELLKNKEKATDLEKARIIYDFIEDNFNYSNTPFLHSALTPQRASKTLNSRLGDCKDLAVLFTSMAREASLDANLVLVDTRDEGETNIDEIPTIDFNHCIAQLKTATGNYFVELTDNMLPFGSMSSSLINSNALIIPKDGGQTNSAVITKLNSRSRPANSINRKTTVDINAGNITVKRQVDRTGAETAVTRSFYKNISDDEKKKSISKALSDEFSNSLSLTDFKFTNLNSLTDSLRTTETFRLDKYFTEIAGMQIMSVPWLDKFNSLDFISLEKRNYPLNLWEYSRVDREFETMTINLPAGKKWLEVPKNISYKCPSLNYKQTVLQQGNKLILTREVNYLKEAVPVVEYDEFKKTINLIAESDKKQIAFR